MWAFVLSFVSADNDLFAGAGGTELVWVAADPYAGFNDLCGAPNDVD
jgi:hypothetical protein